MAAEVPSATYCVVLDSAGEFRFGIGDMDITSQISVDWVGITILLFAVEVLCIV